MIGNKKAISALKFKKSTEDIIYLKKLIEHGKIKTVIDRTYPLSDTAEAHKHSEPLGALYEGAATHGQFTLIHATKRLRAYRIAP